MNFCSVIPTRIKTRHFFIFRLLLTSNPKRPNFVGSVENSLKIDQQRHKYPSVFLFTDFYNDRKKFKARVQLLYFDSSLELTALFRCIKTDLSVALSVTNSELPFF